VFNRVKTDCSQSSLCVHVDDFMITTTSEPLDLVLADMNNVFGDVSVVRGRKHDYLGMVFDFTSDDCLRVSMLTTVSECIHSVLSTRSRDLPVGSWRVACLGSDTGCPLILVCFFLQS